MYNLNPNPVSRRSPVKKPGREKLITIVEGLSTSTVSGPFPYDLVRNLCAYRPEGYQFFPRYQKGQWDGYVSLAKKMFKKTGKPTMTLPSGFIPRLITSLTTEGYKVKVSSLVDAHPIQVSDVSLKKSILRDYQKEALVSCIENRRGILHLPPGSGKTLIAAAFIQLFNRPTVFLTHKRDIFSQTEKVFREELKLDVGVIGMGRYEPGFVTIASVPTISKNWKKYEEHLKTKELLIADEVHRAAAKTWYLAIKRIPAFRTLGLTATPLTTEKKILVEANCGPIIHKVRGTSLIEQGYLSKPEIYMCTVNEGELGLPEWVEYHEAYQRGIVENDTRNEAIVNIVEALPEKNFPVAILVWRRNHLDILNDLFSETSLRVQVLSGTSSAGKREGEFQKVRDRKLDVLLISTIFDEGVDIPELRTLVVAGGMKSPIGTIQRLGRGMRKTESKNTVLVIDFLDESHMYLRRHSKKRRTSYRREGYKVKSLLSSDLLPKLKML